MIPVVALAMGIGAIAPQAAAQTTADEQRTTTQREGMDLGWLGLLGLAGLFGLKRNRHDDTHVAGRPTTGMR